MSALRRESSPDDEIEKWLSEIGVLYGSKNATQFKEEKPILRQYLKKLKAEATPSGRLAMCKLQSAYKRGGTAIIFKALHSYIQHKEIALKFNRPRISGDTRALVENELQILPELDHSNIIRVIDVGKFDIKFKGDSYPLSFIVEPFIPDTTTLRQYVASLSHKKRQDVNAALIDSSLQSLTSVLSQWVEALEYIHGRGYVYLDVKPDNAIVDGKGHLLVIDFGSAQKVDLEDESSIEIYITDYYADPRLKRQILRSTSPDRIKSAVKRKDLTYDVDSYPLGRSILELLRVVSKDHPHDFPQRPLFQSLHFLAARLLNGMNEERSHSVGGNIVSEVFPGLRRSDYDTIQYKDLKDVLRDLKKETGSWNPEKIVPELETYPKETVRFVPKMNTVLTPRLRDLLEHPLISRLKMVSQLGLTSLVYPTADHTRYDHVLGSYTYTASYIKSLYNDSYNCMFRNLVDDNDIKAALLASILHDLGQYPLAHDLQEVHQKIFDHTGISLEMLIDPKTDKEGRTLLNIIQDVEDGWRVDLGRIKRILGAHSGQLRLLGVDVRDFKADMLSALIDGPIDADKADYIIRDTAECRIPYGQQLDIERLLGVLTTVRIPEHLQVAHKVTVGVYEKGRASASAFSLARYLLFACVYWHHTSRIIKAMLQYAVVTILPPEVFYNSQSGKITELREKLIHFVKQLAPPFEEIREEIQRGSSEISHKQKLAAEPPTDVLRELIKSKKTTEEKGRIWYPGISNTDWLMLNWLKTLTELPKSARGAALIDMILQRRLYKRAFQIQRNDTNREMMMRLDELTWLEKINLSETIQKIVHKTIKDREPTLETRPLTQIDEVERLFDNYLVILVDIPNPEKYTESGRPLIYFPALEKKTYYHDRILPVKASNLHQALESLMKSISPVRVLCHPEIRQWVGACIGSKEMRTIVKSSLKRV